MYNNLTYYHEEYQRKAANLDTDYLVEYFKSIGAKYFMALANHHDRFDKFNSTHFAWNSVNTGSTVSARFYCNGESA